MGRNHHRWDLAAKQGVLGPFGDYSVPDQGLPRASGGQTLTAEQLSRLSTGISNNSLRSSDGHDIQRTGKGVTLTQRLGDDNRPWLITGAPNGYLCLDPGRLYVLNTSYPQRVDIRQEIPNMKFEKDADALYNRGGEFTINIKNKAGSNSCYDLDNKVVTTSAGRYSARLFFGRDGGEPWTSSEDMPEDYALWFDFDFSGPVLRYTKASEVPNVGVIIVAYVFKSGQVWQILKSDLVLPDIRPWPFQVTYFQENDKWRFRVYHGTYNGQLPLYGNTNKNILDLKESGEIPTTSKSIGVYLRIEPTPSAPFVFPKPDGLRVFATVPYTGATDDTNAYHWVPLSYAEFENIEGKIVLMSAFQAVYKHLVGTAYKLNDKQIAFNTV